MNRTYFQRVSEMTPTRVWINNPTRDQARQAIAAGAIGCTTNPSYIGKMLDGSEDGEYVRGKIRALLAAEADDTRLLERVYSEMVAELAGIFRPIHEESRGAQGYVSIQGDPFNESEENILSYAMKNHAMADNITPKIPFVESAKFAVEKLLLRGVPLNITEIMAMRQALDVHEIYEKAAKSRSPMPVVYYSHIMGIFNEHMAEYVAQKGIDIAADTVSQAGIAVARKMVQILSERKSRIEMISGGARTVENFTDMVGAPAYVTINWHGTFDVLLERNEFVVQKFLQLTPDSVVDELLEKVPDFGRAYMMGGITEAEYEEYGPVVKFRNSFQKGWKIALSEIAKLRRESR
jgi:transaldolase